MYSPPKTYKRDATRNPGSTPFCILIVIATVQYLHGYEPKRLAGYYLLNSCQLTIINDSKLLVDR